MGSWKVAERSGPAKSLRIPILGRAGVPDTGVGAVSLNVTATRPTEGGYLTVYPTGETRPLASNLNFRPGQTVANAVIARVGADGSITVYNRTGSTHVFVDISGWFPDTDSFTAMSPARIAETRTGSNDLTIDGLVEGGGAIGPGQSLRIPILGRAGVPDTGVGAVSLNVTATPAPPKADTSHVLPHRRNPAPWPKRTLNFRKDNPPNRGQTAVIAPPSDRRAPFTVYNRNRLPPTSSSTSPDGFPSSKKKKRSAELGGGWQLRMKVAVETADRLSKIQQALCWPPHFLGRKACAAMTFHPRSSVTSTASSPLLADHAKRGPRAPGAPSWRPKVKPVVNEYWRRRGVPPRDPPRAARAAGLRQPVGGGPRRASTAPSTGAGLPLENGARRRERSANLRGPCRTASRWVPSASAGSPEQARRNWLPKLKAGEGIGAFGLTETALAAATPPRVCARR